MLTPNPTEPVCGTQNSTPSTGAPARVTRSLGPRTLVTRDTDHAQQGVRRRRLLAGLEPAGAGSPDRPLHRRADHDARPRSRQRHRPGADARGARGRGRRRDRTRGPAAPTARADDHRSAHGLGNRRAWLDGDATTRTVTRPATRCWPWSLPT